MSMEVVEITKVAADLFVKNKHYSRRQGFFKKAYGLVIDGMIEGVVVYGIPILQVSNYAFSKGDRERGFDFYELVRLVVQTDRKNAASFLVANSLRKLGRCAVISYADTAWGHSGIVYQATNWLYTGATKSHDTLYLVNGERIHPKTLASRGIKSPAKWAAENNIERIPPSLKHRYMFFVGNKYERAAMLADLRYKLISEYPKSEHLRYDDGEKVICEMWEAVK